MFRKDRHFCWIKVGKISHRLNFILSSPLEYGQYALKHTGKIKRIFVWFYLKRSIMGNVNNIFKWPRYDIKACTFLVWYCARLSRIILLYILSTYYCINTKYCIVSYHTIQLFWTFRLSLVGKRCETFYRWQLQPQPQLLLFITINKKNGSLQNVWMLVF